MRLGPWKERRGVWAALSRSEGEMRRHRNRAHSNLGNALLERAQRRVDAGVSQNLQEVALAPAEYASPGPEVMMAEFAAAMEEALGHFIIPHGPDHAVVQKNRQLAASARASARELGEEG